jgi:chromosome segregation ATPase
LQQQTSKLESDTAANNIVETLKTTLAATTYVDEQNSNLTSRLDKIDVSLNSIDGNINTIAPSLNKNDENSIMYKLAPLEEEASGWNESKNTIKNIGKSIDDLSSRLEVFEEKLPGLPETISSLTEETEKEVFTSNLPTLEGKIDNGKNNGLYYDIMSIGATVDKAERINNDTDVQNINSNIEGLQKDMSKDEDDSLYCKIQTLDSYVSNIQDTISECENDIGQLSPIIEALVSTKALAESKYHNGSSTYQS